MSALCHGCGTQIDEDEDVLCGNCKHDDAIRRECDQKLLVMRNALGMAIHAAVNFGRDHPAIHDLLAMPTKIYHDSAAILGKDDGK